jgi:hypothetical protein
LAEPTFKTASAKIRWYVAMGYTVNEIAKWTGIKYQMVRNISSNVPKRAAREDMPALIVKLKVELIEEQMTLAEESGEGIDFVRMGMDEALEASLRIDRRERRSKHVDDSTEEGHEEA